MPPGNSSNKPAVVERCSYCGSSSCSGERNHITRRLDPVDYGLPPTSYAPRTSSIATAGTERVLYGSADRFSKTQAAVPKSSLTTVYASYSRNTGPYNTVRSDNNDSVVGVSLSRPPAISSSVSYRSNGNDSLNKTAGSTNTYSAYEKPVSQSVSNLSQSSVTSSKAVHVGSTTLSSVNEKPSALRPAVTLSNQLSKESDSVLSSKTIFHTTYSNTDAKPSVPIQAVSPSSQVGGDKCSITPCFTPVASTNTTVAPKPLTSYQKSSLISNSDVSSASNDVSNINTTKVIHKNVNDVKQESISSYGSSKVDLKRPIDRNGATALHNKDEYQLSTGNDLDSQDLLKKHSKRASVFEGAVVRFVGSRLADVKVNDPDGSFKLAQLFVEKLSRHRNAPAYAASVDIRSVLRVGDSIKLVCTEHKKKDSGFHYFAHQAWKTEDDSLNNNWVNNDAESVNSFASYSSIHDSEKQSGKSATRRRRRRKETNEQTSNVLGVDIPQWLDSSSQLGGNLAQSEALIEGCEYTGKVAKMRLPFAFVVQVELNKCPQCIFVYSKYFYPEGPNSSAMIQGVPINHVVSIGDVVVVIPIRSNQQKNEFEWVARKAWPKGKELAASEVIKNVFEKVPKNHVEPIQLKNSDFVWVKSDQDGVILTLQTDWGLVGDLKNEHVFVFTRKHSYLFGLSLKSFFLEDVLMEGDLVKYSQEEGEKGEMNANLLYFGCPLPDFNSFVKAINEYCESRNIKHSIETELTLLGEAMYSFK